MTSPSHGDLLSPRAEARKAGSRSLFDSPTFVIVLGLVLAFGIGWRQLAAVWETQAFADTDDAMRLVEVRDWLAGQGWFDLTAYRLDPPHGTLMHWTRVLDLPLAGLIRFFGLFADTEWAERLTRITYPILLQIALFLTSAGIAARLTGRLGVAPAVILTAFSIAVANDFAPGRIAHHNAQIVLLMLMLAATLAALEEQKAYRGALAGFFAALSLSINIENLPFILMMSAVFGITWIVRGKPIAPALAGYGAGLAASSLAVFAWTIPPSLYFADVCDAFGAAHLVGTVAGGVGCGALAALRLAGRMPRLAAAAVAGGLTLAAVGLTYPDCFGDPFAKVDPLVHEVWIRNVTESQPMLEMLRTHLLDTLPQAMPLFLGVALTAVAAAREGAAKRMSWLAVAAFGVIGIIGATWQIRVAYSAAPIAALGGAWLFVTLVGFVQRRSAPWRPLPVLLLLPLAPAAWGVIPATAAANGTSEASGDAKACFASSAFTALDKLPPSTLLAPFDAASYILAFTPHSVVAGPYHRNNHGNRLALDIFLGDAVTAKRLFAASGARLVAVCPAADELALYAKRAPDGLAAQLRRGQPPAWLKLVKVEGTPYKLYESRDAPPLGAP